jgi:hypothetical protein
MKLRVLSVVIALAGVSGCGGSADVDLATALPGSWRCDDGLVIDLQAPGHYEWRVPPGGPVHFPFGGNEHVRVNDDGSYALLGSWRLSGGTLELDMLGETERFNVSFGNRQSLRLRGPESYSCSRM